MKFLTFLKATKSAKKLSLLTIPILATLLLSGILGTIGASTAAAGHDPTAVTQTSATLGTGAAAPTFFGTASGLSSSFLSGPFSVPSAFGPAPVPPQGNPSPSVPNYKTDVPASFVSDQTSKPGFNLAGGPTSVDPPESGCSSGSGCLPVSWSSGGAETNPFTLNAVDSRLSYGYNIEPPDQGLCANSQYVVETLNIGTVQVYSPDSLNPVSGGYATLDNLMGLPSHTPTAGSGTGWGSGGDVMCNYDSANGGHWFFTEFVSTTAEPEAPFTGCFVGVSDTCREGIAVSQTNNPMGAYWVYFLDPNFVNSDPGASTATLLNDFCKQALTQDAFLLFYDEFNLIGPGYAGGSGFNGAQEFAFSKAALETGAVPSKINVAYENMGTAANIYPIPANGNFQPPQYTGDGTCLNAGLCWGYAIPAQTPDSSQYDNKNGGTGWMVATLDFIGFGDDRVAAFSWTGLCALDTKCTNTVQFGGTLYTTPQVVYLDEGLACFAQFQGFCGLAQQKAGPIPQGDLCGARGLSTIAESCPEGGIATNGDAATQASYANGQLWTAVSTLVTQSFGYGSEVHVGAAYWAIGDTSVGSAGVVSATHEDMEFPAVAATDGGAALLSFTLSGPDYYPSSAFTWLSPGGQVHGDSLFNSIYITANGKSPQDGFTEYQFFPNNPNYRPRWGDYGAAIFVSSTGHDGFGDNHGGSGTIFFGSEYIQYPNCSDQAYSTGIVNGITCGGTRTTAANWGSSISSISSQ